MAGRSRRKLKSRKKKNQWIPVCLILAVLAGAASFLCVSNGLPPAGLLDVVLKEIPESVLQKAESTKEAVPEAGNETAGTEEIQEESESDPSEEMERAEEESSPVYDRSKTESQEETESTEETESETESEAPAEQKTRYAFDAPDTLKISQADPEVITLRFAGDILFDESYAIMASMLQRSGSTPDISTAFDSGMLSLMRGADIFMVNNEFPYSSRGTPLANKQFTFRARPKYASLLHDMGVDIVGIANNHVNDHGKEAMLDTFDTLNSIGMPFVGAGHDLAEASRIQYFTNGDVKIGIIAATQIERMGNPDTVGATEDSPGVFRCMNPKNLIAKIREAKENCDCCIVFVHWGTEGKNQTDSWQEEQAVQFAEAGADVIVGGHPHVLEKIVSVKGVPCIFSLGNYLFNSKTLDTGLFELTLDAKTGEIRGTRFIPALQSGCRTTLLSGAEKERVLDFLRSLSPGTSIDTDGNITF